MSKEFRNYALLWSGIAIAAVAHVSGWIFHQAELWVSLLFAGAVLIAAGMFLEERRQQRYY